MRSREELLAAFNKIKDQINQQLPLVSNRFEHDHSALAMIKAKFEYLIYKHINKALGNFLQETGLKDPLDFSEEQLNEAEKRVHSTFVLINEDIERKNRIIKEAKTVTRLGSNISADEVKTYLKENTKQLLAIWQKTLHLSIQNPPLEKQFELDDELLDHQEQCINQFMFNKINLENSSPWQTEAAQNIKKASCFWHGIYFEQIAKHIGSSDEHTCIALKKIVEDWNIISQNLIEKVDTHYFNDEGKKSHGRTFIVINRYQGSSLDRPGTWGKEAIVFDLENQLVCFAEDLKKHPEFFSYPGVKKSTSIQFDRFDVRLMESLISMNDYYAIAGNKEIENRTLRLIEEFQLTSLDANELAGVGKVVHDIIKDVWPQDLKMNVLFFVSTEGNQLVTTLPGFDQPAIIIHRHFLADPNYSLEELRFALAHELLYIQHHGAGLTEGLSALDTYKLDKLALEKTHLGEAAIRYLRWDIVIKDNPDYPKAMKLPVLKGNYFLIGACASPEQRIKAISAQMAENEELAGTTTRTILHKNLQHEAASLRKKTFYTDICYSKKTNQEKLNYLQSQLQDLHVELLPYEYTLTPSIRGREFCKLLRELKLNFVAPKELQVIHEFISAAFELRVPAFVELYYAVCGLQAKQFIKKQTVPALGIFAEVQQTINVFINATHYLTAKAAAIKLMDMQKQLQGHFVTGHISNPIASHYEKYKKKHHEAIPIGRDRYFGSWLSTNICWQGFTKTTMHKLPWDQHVIWAKQDTETVISQTLWFLGVHKDARVWDTFSPNKLLDQLNNNENGYANCSIPLPLELRGEANNDKLIKHLSGKHKLQQSMWQEEHSFEQAFIQFYDLNLPMLVSPADKLQRNVDNIAIHSLLSHFANTAGEDTEKDKVMKSFFLGRKDTRDLKHLTYYINDEILSSCITHNLMYTSFVLEQEYRSKTFRLFTLKEQIEFMNQFLRIYHHIDPMRVVKLFNLPFNQLNHACLTAVIPLIKQNDMTLDWMLIGRMLSAYAIQYKLPDLFSRRSIELINFSEFAKKPEDRKTILSQFVWKLPKHAGLSHQALIKIYHAFDANLLFPTLKIQHQYGRLLLKEIENITTLNDRIAALQSWLFNTDYCLIDMWDKNYYPPMSDFKLRNHLIELLVNDLLAKYGKDNGSKVYAMKFKQLMDEIKSNAPNRDLKHTLARLMDAVEAQAELSSYADAFIIAETNNQRIQDKKKTTQMAVLYAMAEKIGEYQEGQKKLIAFLASPLSKHSLKTIADYIASNEDIRRNLELIGREERSSAMSQEDIKMVMLALYHEFWSIKLNERALVMEALLVSPDKMITKTQELKAYRDALSHVMQRLLPSAAVDPDEHFAQAFIKSYLNAASPYMRPYLIAGLLVASNESQAEEKVGVGKKLALFCEHMGPAYIKLAQAIHSHPSTPKNLKADLDHIKGRANPPYRWDLWRLLAQVLPDEELKKIKRIGTLLGSASYNMALEVELFDGSQVVLLLLRENAEKEAKNGFIQLKKTLSLCKHQRMHDIRETGVSILAEAEKLSIIEMDHELSRQQAQIAAEMYQDKTTISINDKQYSLNLIPTTIISSGKGYRFLTRMYGPEFNELPENTAFKKEIAKVVFTVELINILSGSYFDSDRHGNQLRVNIDHHNAQITLGLYDFGEMALEKPGEAEIQLMAKVISELPSAIYELKAFDKAMDEVLSRNIKQALENGMSVTYLTRVRKAVLALQDFQSKLSLADLFAVLKTVSESQKVHAVIKEQLKINDMFHWFFEGVHWVSSFFESQPETQQKMPSKFQAFKSIAKRDEIKIKLSRDDNHIINKHILEKYLLPCDGSPKVNLYAGDIERIIHGKRHASCVAIWVTILANLLASNDALVKMSKDFSDDLLYLRLTAFLHDVARKGEGADCWEAESEDYCQQFLEAIGLSPERAYYFASLITSKDENTGLEFSPDSYKTMLFRMLLQCADALEIMRCVKKFQLKKLSLWPIFVMLGLQDKVIELAKHVLDFIADKQDLMYDCKIMLDDECIYQRKATLPAKYIKQLGSLYNNDDNESRVEEEQPDLKEAYEHSTDCHERLLEAVLEVPFLAQYCQGHTVGFDTLRYQETPAQKQRKAIRAAAPKVEVNGDFFIKGLRNGLHSLDFFDGVLPGHIHHPLRNAPKLKYTVNGHGIFKRSEKKPQYTAEQKKDYSKGQPTSMSTAAYHAPLFVFGDSEQKVIGALFLDNSDVLLTSQLSTQDFGSVGRTGDFDEEYSAKTYFAMNKSMFYPSEKLDEFRKELESKKHRQSNQHNECIVRLRWSANNKCQILINTDTLETRLLAQVQKRIIKQRLLAKNACAADYEVSLCYYNPRNPAIHLKQYTLLEQELDLQSMLQIANNPVYCRHKFAGLNFEFLLLLPKQMLQEIINPNLLITMANTGNPHFNDYLMELGSIDSSQLDHAISRLFEELDEHYKDIKERHLKTDQDTLAVSKFLENLSTIILTLDTCIGKDNQSLFERIWNQFISIPQKFALAMKLSNLPKMPFSPSLQLGLIVKAINQTKNSHYLSRLLQFSAFDFAIISTTGESILHYAAKSPYSTHLQKCMESGLTEHLNTADQDGNTPLHYAAASGNLGGVRALLKMPGIISCPENNKGLSPFTTAVSGQRLNTTKYLIEHYQLNLNSLDKSGQNIYQLALKHFSMHILYYFLEMDKSVSVNQQDAKGETVLHTLVRLSAKDPGNVKTYVVFLELFLHKGADPSIQNTEGQTVLDLANSLDLKATSKVLENIAAKSNEKTELSFKT